MPMLDEIKGTETTIGFVILSHTSNSHLARLICKLNDLYGFPPIVVHHDYSQAPLPISQSAPAGNVSIVRPHLRTRWGDFSIVRAFLVALELLYDKYSPDWFANISTSCYPVANPSSVLSELKDTDYDAFLGAVMLYPEMQYPSNEEITSLGEILLSPSLPTHTSDIRTWMSACYRRYVATELSNSLFGPGFGCFAGDQWFTANSKSASILLKSTGAFPDLVRHYSRVHVPDESFCQTVLCNDTDLKISKCNRRFVNWYTKGAHPLELNIYDLQAILNSGCHFARKFTSDTSSDLIEAIDRRHFHSAIARQI